MELRSNKLVALLVTITLSASQYAWAQNPSGRISTRTPQNSEELNLDKASNFSIKDLEEMSLANHDEFNRVLTIGNARNTIESIKRTLEKSDSQWSRALTVGAAQAVAKGDTRQADFLNMGRANLQEVRESLLAMVKQNEEILNNVSQNDLKNLPQQCLAIKSPRSVAAVPPAQIPELKECVPVLNALYDKYKDKLPKLELGCTDAKSCLLTTGIIAAAGFLVIVFAPIVAVVFVPAVVIITIYAWFKDLNRPADQKSCYPGE